MDEDKDLDLAKSCLLTLLFSLLSLQDKKLMYTITQRVKYNMSRGNTHTHSWLLSTPILFVLVFFHIC